MLPSLRLIVATFLCGFLAVFASLRVATFTRLAHDSLPGLATPAVAAPAIVAPMAPVAPPIASVAAADPPWIGLVMPVMFDLNSVISTTAVAPEAATVAPDRTPVPTKPAPPAVLPELVLQPAPAPEAMPVPAQLAKLTILPEIALQSVPEPMPVPAEIAPLTILPEIALQSVPEPEPVLAEPAEMTAVAPALTPPANALEIALRSAPETTPADPPEPATIPAEPVPPAMIPMAAETSTETPAAAEVTGLVEPVAPVSPGMDALNQNLDQPPVTVMIRLPVAKPPLRAMPPPRAKTATVRPKRPRTVSRDPFGFNFGQPHRPF